MIDRELTNHLIERVWSIEGKANALLRELDDLETILAGTVPDDE